MFSVRIWKGPLKAFFQQGPRLCTSNTAMCKSQLPLLLARFLSSKESVSILHGRHQSNANSAQGEAKRSTFRHRDEGPWDDAMTGKGNTSSVRQAPVFPKSVFAAGTAKRTAEMLRRKAALLSQDEDDESVEESRGPSARGAGRRGQPVFVKLMYLMRKKEKKASVQLRNEEIKVKNILSHK